MPRTTYFTHGTRNEQFLQQNLVEEYIKMFGMDILYCPREIMEKDGVFNEEVIGEFNDSYLIEAYMENFDGFQGGGDLLTKFGVAQTDEITMIVSQQRFTDLISQFLLVDKDYQAPERPQEGDLIFLPLTSNYFEIKFVEHEEPFYQLGKGYVYKLKAELFEYSDEQGDVFDNDEEIVDYGYTVKHFYLTTAGTTATGTSVLTGGELTNIFITDNGSSYNETPLITITGDGQDAAAEAFMANITVSGGSPTKSAVIRSVVKDGQIRSVNIVDGGENYDEDRAVLNVTAPDAGGIAATLVPTFTNGVLTAINILSGGSGYKSVKLIDITNAGSGYTSATIAFTPAPAGLTGAFQVPEQVTGGTTGHTAQLVEWNAQEGFVKLKSPTGSFVVGELIMGATSGATIVLDNKNEMATADPKYSESVTFESLGDDIIDFSESNPFGLVT
tara:strand:+ start:290 stop:1621 length:1332 start_codon:yes stop_codon:yes gene_type:complete